MTDAVLDLWAVRSFVSYVALINLFAAAMHAKAILARGERVHFIFLGPLAIGAVVGWLLDVAFNMTIGSLVYLELPHELTFTSRCKRHKKRLDWRSDKAKWWCKQLNKFDPGHC